MQSISDAWGVLAMPILWVGATLIAVLVAIYWARQGAEQQDSRFYLRAGPAAAAVNGPVCG